MKKAVDVDWPQRALDQVRDNAAYWHSDRAKRVTVVKYLEQQGCPHAAWLISELLRKGILYEPVPGYVAVVPIPQREKKGGVNK